MMQLLWLAVVCWLPGAAIFRLPWLERDKRAALPAEERAFWAVILSIAVSLSVVMALAAAHQYTFERLLILDGAVAGAAALAARGRLLLGAAAARPTGAALLPILLILLGAWRFFPPAEYIVGGRDPGVYMNAGIQIAQRGAFLVDDPVVASVPPFARDLFFPQHEGRAYHSVRFMGFWILDPDSGQVVSQFPHLYPASIAVGYGIDGVTGARRTTGFWAIAGLLAVYFTAARLFGRSAAFAATALLAFHVVQLWFARYPNTEILMQTMLFAALLANARAHADGDHFFAPVAGLLLGLLLFLRFDAVLGVAGVAGGWAAAALAGRRPRLSMVLTLALAAALAIPYMLGPMRGYAELPIHYFGTLRWWNHLAIVAAAAGVLWALMASPRHPRLAAASVRWLPPILAASVVLGAAYALFVRMPGGRLAAHDAFALRTFANLYVTVPAVIAAVAGYALFARRLFWRAPALFVTIAVFGFFFFYKIRIVPEHLWMARRFVPVILPATMILAAALAFAGARTSGGFRLLHTTLGAVFVLLLAANYYRVSTPVANHVEYAGLIPRLERLASTLGDGLVIVESRNASDTHVLALPLANIYARNVLVLNSPAPDKATFGAFLAWARSRYPQVLFVGGGGTMLLSRKWGIEAVASDRFQVPEYETSHTGLPRGARHKEFDYSVYRFTDSVQDPGTAPFELDVGIADDLHVRRFHAKEETEGRTFRWTRDASYVSLTTMKPTSRVLTLWMSDGGRPPAVAGAEVTVTLNEQLLGTLRVGTGFRDYQVSIPPDVAARFSRDDAVQIKLAVNAWNPSQVLGGGDDRELGVMVDRVQVR